MYGMNHTPKVVAVDFDETITDAPEVWLRVMKTLEQAGYIVYVVTYRHSYEWPEDLDFLRDKGYKVFCTGRMAKRHYMKSKGINVHIFIDDTPEACVFDMDQLTGAFVAPLEY